MCYAVSTARTKWICIIVVVSGGEVGLFISFFYCFVLKICKRVVAISDDIAYDEDRLRRHIVKAMVRQSQIRPRFGSSCF